MSSPKGHAVYATGRRKTSVARVFLSPGQGHITINRRTIEDYFPREALQRHMNVPLEVIEGAGRYDLRITVKGGGIAGQAGAIRHGIARALERFNPTFRVPLKRAGLLTRDARAKERKKYGQRAARARFQFSKR